jgi:hypothetical protein
MNPKDVISLCMVVATAGTAVTVALSADDPAPPLSSHAHNVARPDTVTTSDLPSSLRAILNQRASVLSPTSSSPSEHDEDRQARDARARRTNASGTRPARPARARRTDTAHARPARTTRSPRRRITPPRALTRPPAPPAPHVGQRVAPQPPPVSTRRTTPPPPPTSTHRTTRPPPPPTTWFDDSG